MSKVWIEVASQIAKLVEDDVLYHCISYSGRKALSRISLRSETFSDDSFYIDFTSAKAEDTCSLFISFVEGCVKCAVNYSAHGDADVGLCMARANFITQVCLLGDEIERTVWKVELKDVLE